MHRHARKRIVGAIEEDYEPWELTTNTYRLTVDDRHMLVRLFRRQAEMHQELADEIEEEGFGPD